MTKHELDSLTVFQTLEGQVHIWNSSGLVGNYSDRDEAYAAVLAFRGHKRIFPAGINSRTEPRGLFSGLSAKLVERSQDAA